MGQQTSKAEASADATIKIGGTEMKAEFNEKLLQVVVDMDLQMPGMFTIDIYDDDFELVDGNDIDLGKEVVISVETSSAGQPEKIKGDLITGEITSIEPNFDDNGRCILRIRGYDKSHRLHRGKKTETFLKMTDDKIASKLFNAAGLKTGSSTSTKIKYDYVIQNNQTDMEFLMTRARRIGFYITTDPAGKIHYNPVKINRGDGPKLKWQESLISFQPRATAVQQADKASAWAWDIKANKALEGKVSKTLVLKHSKLGFGGTASKKAFSGSSEVVVSHVPTFNQDDAKAVAQAALDRINDEYIQAEGVSFGNPGVQAGKLLTIEGVSKKFSGKYFVTSARHVYSRGKYRTYFTISGHEPQTLTHLLSSQTANSEERQGLIRGVVIGKVTNVKDKAKLGRVKLQFPWLNKKVESDWARISSPTAGKESGMVFIPEVNDEVLVAFDRGDPNYPYVIGMLWNAKDKMPKGAIGDVIKDGKINERVIVSRSGHIISLVDEKGKEQIVIRDKTGKNEIIIDSKKKSIMINVTKDLIIEAGGKIEITAKGDIKFKGKNIDFDAQMKFKVKGGTGGIELKSSAGNVVVEGLQLKLKGAAGAELKGGAGVIKFTGPMVNINNGALEIM